MEERAVEGTRKPRAHGRLPEPGWAQRAGLATEMTIFKTLSVVTEEGVMLEMISWHIPVSPAPFLTRSLEKSILRGSSAFTQGYCRINHK